MLRRALDNRDVPDLHIINWHLTDNQALIQSSRNPARQSGQQILLYIIDSFDIPRR